jgi:DNA-binding SARP family transcriptional activator
MISCRVLGPIEVMVGEAAAPTELLWRKHLALLIYLARSPKRARTREHLCGLLWPDKDERAARHSLNEALRVLRRSGLEEGLDTSGGQVRLLPDAVQLDADALAGLVEREAWADAARLIAGEFLEGFGVAGCEGFEDWLAAERRHWSARCTGALLGWSDALLREGRAAEALAAAARAGDLDPLSEAAAMAGMAALAAQGDLGAALSLAERLAARLRELHLEPGTELLRLGDRLRRGRTRPRVPSPPAPAERRRAPLVGRSGALGSALDTWDRARAGQGASILVLEGDAGTGKSRLLDELASRAVLSGGSVALVRAMEGDDQQPCSGLLGLCRGGLLDAPGISAAAPDALAALACRLPEWAERFRAEAPPPPQALPAAFSAVVAAAAGEAPLLLALDDAQWADRDSLLGLPALIRNQSRMPLCLVLTLTPHPPREELDGLRRRLGDEVSGMMIRLAPLDGEALRELAGWALPTYDAVALERVARRVAGDSAGIPFLAVELLTAVAQGLDLTAGGAVWPAASHTLTQTLPADLPDNVVAALRVGFRRLGDDARQVLAAAAVLGGRTSDPLLARAADLPLQRVEAALDELEWQRWLESDGQGYGFVARLAGQVIARDMVTPGQQARIRQRISPGT